MFTIGEGENHDPKSPGNSGVTTESIFSGPTPSNFWIVTSFVIPNDLKSKDWWVVAFIDEHGNVVFIYFPTPSVENIVLSPLLLCRAKNELYPSV